MKRLLLCLLIPLAPALSASAQDKEPVDTIYHVSLRNLDVNSTRKWHDDTVRYHYNQMKYYVTTILPYVIEATAIFNELNTRLKDPALTGSARRQYIRQKEAVVRDRFEDKIRSLNETQGVLIIKLTARQTGFNIYEQLSDFKGALPAMKWQAWARIHGFSLARKYHPEEEHDLEQIMRSLGYPLPTFYGGDGSDGY